MIFEPMDFMARLAALVPKPQCAPDAISWRYSPRPAPFRARVVPKRRAGGGTDSSEKSLSERHWAMT